MNQGKYVFSQIMEFAPHYQFKKCVKKYGSLTNFMGKDLTCHSETE